jgi:hypothetical protein
MEIVTLKFKGPEGELQIVDIATVKRGETCQCPKDAAEALVLRAPDSWEIVSDTKTNKGKDD